MPASTRRRRRDAGFNVRSLFAAGEQGGWWDPSDTSTLFQDSAGTTPVTTLGQPVGLVLDKSGNGNHAILTNATWRITAEGDHYIQYGAGGSFDVTFPAALGTCSVAYYQPSRQAFQTQRATVGASVSYTTSHGPIVIVGRVITPQENAALTQWARLNIFGIGPMTWTRDPSWLPLPSLSNTDQQFVGLIAVWPERNFTAFTAAGNYAVDWGDGTSNTYSSGATALKELSYTTPALAGTDAPVTLVSATNRVQRTAHGYASGDTITLWNVTGSTGVVSGQQYYVINATPDDFQVSETLYGSPVVLGADGAATLLPYKQAIVSVTPQTGQDLTALNLNVRHTTASQAYETGWLDIEVGSPSFSASGLVIRTTVETVRMRMVERIRIAALGGQTTMANMFRDCVALQSVPLFSTTNVTTMVSMFQNCSALQSVPLFDTANVTTMVNMLQDCRALQSVPLFNTTNVTTMANTFFNCADLKSVPLFDTTNVTTMASMFFGCSDLQSVPLFNTANVTTMASMFRNASALQSVPLFNTTNVTTMANMFSGCRSLQSVPLFSTNNVTTMANMFQDCSALQSVPLFNTTNVTTMANMFLGCLSLQSVPLFSTNNVTTMASMFSGCNVLRSVPAMSAAAVTSAANLATLFLNCNNLSRMAMTGLNYSFSLAACNLDGPELDAIYTALPVTVGQTITVTGNYGIATHNPTIATAKGWAVAT
jgi:surface protein